MWLVVKYAFPNGLVQHAQLHISLHITLLASSVRLPTVLIVAIPTSVIPVIVDTLLFGESAIQVALKTVQHATIKQESALTA
jgi:hypothetical protein